MTNPDTTRLPVLVVSCDPYADVWPAFFAAFFGRWPDCPYPVYLGTNSLRFTHRGVTTLNIGEDRGWGAGLLEMLNRLSGDHVLLLLDDFLLQRNVDSARVERLVGLAVSRGVGCLHLAPLPAPTPPPARAVPGLPEVGIVARGSPYRVSTQIAVWRIETLREILIPAFSPWEFEHVGTPMSDALEEEFWCVYEPALHYDHAIEKGKWKPDGLATCAELGVVVDLSVRPAFSAEELRSHYAGGERDSRLHQIKARAIDCFASGRRLQGLRWGLRYLASRPASMQGWAIVSFGMAGPGAVDWLRRMYLQAKVTRYRRKGVRG